ncbi:MAG: aspartate--tRNA ligase [Deltaproteobacteria bacterium]|jgi:aspartyl-tRNA synthetase|nr:aspartate--tRNA ligase [Deltaproteobacteria bacterium]
MKTINNAELNLNNLNQTITIYGWVNRKRNLGGLIFIDLRDRSGIVQLVVRPENKEVSALAEALKNEFVIKVVGKVVERESKNKNLTTGDIEVEVQTLVVLNESDDLPFEINSDLTLAAQDLRLKYRYLDLRREDLKNNLILRHKILQVTREYLNSQNFLEIETPILGKSTPEGARDYLVPSRVSKGNFYALPQSPQIYKQLLMVGGFERYYQIAKCFRDEDLRADRQPEFTQIDLEMSFITEQDVRAIITGLFVKLFKEIKGLELQTPFYEMSFKDAMEFYGSDKPDTRFEMKLQNLSTVLANTNFYLFDNVLKNQGIINAIVVKNAADKYSRKDIDRLTDFAKTYKASGLAWVKLENGELSGSIAKFFAEDTVQALKQTLELEDNDLVLIVADKAKVVKATLGALRLKLANELKLIDPQRHALLWIVDFPLFEFDETVNRYYACHHPFTSPKDEFIDKLETQPAECLAKAYDLVWNGNEIAGGSIRIHKREVQQKMFKALGLVAQEIENKFGFLLLAFKYGTPPHGGLAFGLERLIMLFAGTDNIRDVIAFPKTTSASCLMVECPSEVAEEQLHELGIRPFAEVENGVRR